MHPDDNALDRDKLARELARAIGQIKRVGTFYSPFKELRQSQLHLLSIIVYMSPPGAKGIKVSELSSHLKITPGAVTHTINSLEENGYIYREADPKDRRVVLVKATQSGENFVELKEQELFTRFQELSLFLGEEDTQQLIRLLSSTVSFLSGEKEK